MAPSMPSLMRVLCALGSVLLLFATLVSADAVLDLQTKGKPALLAQLAKSTTCTKDKIMVRKEWGDMSKPDRKAYIKSVLCLMNAPSKLPAGKFPGAKSRYEDFLVTHMQQTLSIHSTGNFLSWHRYFTWSYEQALRNECGYNGTQPYWDWGRWAADPESSPIFDGSDTSMSGNGKKITHAATFISPAQNGGGCVETGPFANMTVRLGPVSPMADPAPPKNPQADGFGLNARCLRRDLGPYLTKNYATTAIIASLITSYKNVGDFQTVMQGGSGVHSAAHFTIGSDPGGDFYTSPGDPAFYLLHAQIDRVWTIWQMQDLPNRMQVMSGGTQMYGGGATQKLTDSCDISNVASKVWQLKDLMSTVDGPFCYVYDSL
ncbi:Di-copper centre-containing protein [Mollisia scopiformis]|uniref:Di-copper centre-containing protein n=1 Tax=Mollisia scopiformis TaxID=149040 RepID=A0A194XPI4_MOLSC|nr:Di-copper centre-containing protein [Mollisia scopiformis]KUJ22160.1 Di-copper centre-containing protein [Mollisia scopiformis]